MQPIPLKRALILDSNQRSALAVTRSLGKKGVPIITADETINSLAGSSKYSQLYAQYPSALYQATSFIHYIAKLCNQHDIEIIFPMTELTSTLLLKNKNILPEVILPFASTTAVDILSDKCQLMHLAKSLDIPFPETIYMKPGAKLNTTATRFGYPMVLKPCLSWIETEKNWLHTAVRFAENEQSAHHIIKQDPAFHAHPFMLQKCVKGHGEGVFAIYNKGKAVTFFAHKRLREKPPRGGVSVLSESATIDPTLEMYARKVLDHVKWHGVAMVEFKVDDDDGTAYLMEINTRFWGSLQLAIDAGVDFPWLLYQIAFKHKVQTIGMYTTGRRLRWILGDLDSLYLLLRDGNATFTRKAQAVLNFLTPHPFNTRHEVNRLSDIKPFFWELKQYIKDLRR